MEQVTFVVRPKCRLTTFTKKRPFLGMRFRILTHTVDHLEGLAAVTGSSADQEHFHHAAARAEGFRAVAPNAYRFRSTGEDAELVDLVADLDDACGGAFFPDPWVVSGGELSGSVVPLDPAVRGVAVIDALATSRSARGGRLGLRVRGVDAWSGLASLGHVRKPLSSREREALRAAYQMGYYESPRRCTMSDIADVLGLSKSAVYHRMNGLERKAIERLVSESTGLEWLEVEAPAPRRTPFRK